MSDWQKILREGSVDTLTKLADKFGHDVIDVEALRPAFENFQMRITPAALDQIKAVGDPMRGMWSRPPSLRSRFAKLGLEPPQFDTQQPG